MVAVTRIDELYADADTLPSFTNAAVEKRLDAKSLPDLAHVYARSAKREAGCPGRDVETANLGESVQYFLGHTVTEIFLVAFRA